MIRQNIILDNHTYICDLYKAVDDLHSSVKKEFIMLRKYTVMSDVIYDTDIYFVEKSVMDEVVADLTNKDIIVWPVPGSRGTAFNTNYSEFNSDYSEHSLCKDGTDLYKLYRQDEQDGVKSYKETSILCDKIRIYHPQTKVELDAVIYIDNYINDIHFHYYCQRMSNLEHQTETEFRIDTNIYSEFVEFYIPNVEDIINKEVFFREDLNILTLNDSEFVNSYKNLIDNINITHTQVVGYEARQDAYGKSGKQFVDEAGITWHRVENPSTDISFTTKLGYTGHTKVYPLQPYYHAVVHNREFDELLKTDADYIGYKTKCKYTCDVAYQDVSNLHKWEPIHEQIVLQHSKGIVIEDEGDSNFRFPQYSMVDEESVKDATFASTHLLTVPFMIRQDVEVEGSLEKAYRKVFLPEVERTIENNYLTYPICMTIFPYSKIDDNGRYLLSEEFPANSDVFMEELRFTLSSRLGFNNGIISVINTFNYPNKAKYPTFKEAYEHYNNVSFSEYTGIIYTSDEEFEDEEVEQKQCAFEIKIASDIHFRQVIYSTYYEADEADDFAFNLDGIFNSWANLPELLVCKVRFVDRYLGNIIVGNNVLVTKEHFKYCVNDAAQPRLFQLHHRQPNWDNGEKIEHYDDMKLQDINFIDKINCIITKKGEEQTIYNVASKPKVVYKPIFFRTQDLQNVQLRSGMSQNIGINLAEYMTKVETFRLVIDSRTVIESARTDIFTLFKVDTSTFKNHEGTYHILDQDGEYISSGKWSIIN